MYNTKLITGSTTASSHQGTTPDTSAPSHPPKGSKTDSNADKAILVSAVNKVFSPDIIYTVTVVVLCACSIAWSVNKIDARLSGCATTYMPDILTRHAAGIGACLAWALTEDPAYKRTRGKTAWNRLLVVLLGAAQLLLGAVAFIPSPICPKQRHT